jgi:hypothetical protein
MFERKQTGKAPEDDKDKTSIPEQREEREERKRGGRHEGHKEHEKKRARGGSAMTHSEEEREERKDGGEEPLAPHHARKRGGKVPGAKGHHRPDRRARGGGADMNPESSAGNMSMVDYERGKRTNKDEEGAGRGSDKNAKGFG